LHFFLLLVFLKKIMGGRGCRPCAHAYSSNRAMSAKLPAASAIKNINSNILSPFGLFKGATLFD
jgi:hypothetical protein